MQKNSEKSQTEKKKYVGGSMRGWENSYQINEVGIGKLPKA